MLTKLEQWPRWGQAALLILVSWLIILAITVVATQLTDAQRNLLKLAGITLTAVLAGWAYFARVIPIFQEKKQEGQLSWLSEEHLIYQLMQTGQFELIYMQSPPSVRLVPRSPHENEERSPHEYHEDEEVTEGN